MDLAALQQPILPLTILFCMNYCSFIIPEYPKVLEDGEVEEKLGIVYLFSAILQSSSNLGKDFYLPPYL